MNPFSLKMSQRHATLLAAHPQEAQVRKQGTHYTIAQAVEACDTSESTLKRRLRNGRFPNAWRANEPENAPWHIPAQDLIEAGLHPRVAPGRTRSSGSIAGPAKMWMTPDASGRVDALELEVDELRETVTDLKVAVAQAQADAARALRRDHGEQLREVLQLLRQQQPNS